MKSGQRVMLSAEGIQAMNLYEDAEAWRGTIWPRTKRTWETCERVKWDGAFAVTPNFARVFLEVVIEC